MEEKTIPPPTMRSYIVESSWGDCQSLTFESKWPALVNLCPLRFGNAQVAADFAHERIGDFRMTRHRRATVIHWITPPRMPAAFANQRAAVPPKMRKQFVPFHAERLTSS